MCGLQPLQGFSKLVIMTVVGPDVVPGRCLCTSSLSPTTVPGFLVFSGLGPAPVSQSSNAGLWIVVSVDPPGKLYVYIGRFVRYPLATYIL